MDVMGEVAAGFETVADAFVDNFDKRGEVGAGVCVFVEGRKVVDLWGGSARPGVPWAANTMAVVFSSTKGATSLTIQALAERGEVTIDVPIADYWPEFATNGKHEITVGQVLTHQSGAIDFPGYEQVVGDPGWWLDLDRVAASLATSVPAWEPGTAHGYHGSTFGLLLGEVVRRATGATLGSAFRTLVAERLEGIDVWIGTPPEQHERVAMLIDSPRVTSPVVAAYLSLFSPEHLTGRAHFSSETGLTELAAAFNRPEIWTAEFPSGGGIGSARGFATMYDALARGGGNVVSERSIDVHTAERVRGPDLVLLFETAFGLGYMRPTPFIGLGPNPGAFGHGGLGGSLAFADPERRVGFGYVMNQLQFPSPGITTTAGALVDALYSCLP